MTESNPICLFGYQIGADLDLFMKKTKKLEDQFAKDVKKKPHHSNENSGTGYKLKFVFHFNYNVKHLDNQ